MELTSLSFPNGGIGLMVCTAFKICSAHGLLSSTMLNVGGGKEVG